MAWWQGKEAWEGILVWRIQPGVTWPCWSQGGYQRPARDDHSAFLNQRQAAQTKNRLGLEVFSKPSRFHDYSLTQRLPFLGKLRV